MMKRQMVAAVAIASAAMASQASAATFDIVTGGSVTFQLTAPIGDYSLGTNWTVPTDDDGNPTGEFPERSGTVRATGLDDNNFPTGRGSRVLEDGGAELSLRMRGLYLYPLNDDGEEVSSFAEVKNFSFRSSEEDLAAGITDEMKLINYVPTSDPNVFTDYSDPSVSHTLTDAQVARLNDGNLRLCCRHTLGGFTINTSGMFVDGVIDNMVERDTNFDGVVDESDYFHLFTMAETSTADVYDLALTDTMAQYLNYGFSAGAFADGDTFQAEWSGGPLNFQGGDVIGNISYVYETATVEAVPVPAALPLLVGGLGALGFVSSRRKRKAA